MIDDINHDKKTEAKETIKREENFKNTNCRIVI